MKNKTKLTNGFILFGIILVALTGLLFHYNESLPLLKEKISKDVAYIVEYICNFAASGGIASYLIALLVIPKQVGEEVKQVFNEKEIFKAGMTDTYTADIEEIRFYKQHLYDAKEKVRNKLTPLKPINDDASKTFKHESDAKKFLEMFGNGNPHISEELQELYTFYSSLSDQGKEDFRNWYETL